MLLKCQRQMPKPKIQEYLEQEPSPQPEEDAAGKTRFDDNESVEEILPEEKMGLDL